MTEVWARFKAPCGNTADRHVVGWRCFRVTMISRTVEDTYKNTLNTWIRANWREFADGLADLAADPVLGADGAYANSTYFLGDGIHVPWLSVINHEVPVIQHAVNRFHGVQSYSEATTYSSPAPAPTAVTAISSTGSWFIVTSTLAPIIGQTVTLSGITPTGYNGNCQVYATSSSSFNCWWLGTSYGAGTAFGTASVPLQKDGDNFAILNFGAGNFTLETCIGSTGQKIHLWNQNASASTIVPFGSEQINGSSTFTLNGNTTVDLESMLVSASAAGCSWKAVN